MEINNGNMKLSIVIPYWETFDLTEKLLKELSIQMRNGVEVILIDDGCNETELDSLKYKLHFHQLKIIHLGENKGLSYARNVGIDEAKGKYIAFIDSDDQITMDYIDRLLQLIEEHNEDIIYFNWADFNENAIIRHPDNYAVWKAIYKNEIVPKFDESKRFNEDVFFQEDLGKMELTKYYYDRVLYIYNSNREGSQMWRRDRQ